MNDNNEIVIDPNMMIIFTDDRTRRRYRLSFAEVMVGDLLMMMDELDHS